MSFLFWLLQRLQNWSAVVSQLSKTSSPKPWSEKLLNVFLQELLIGDRQNFLNSFQLYDVQGRGTLTKEDVAKVIHKHMGRLSESEVSTLRDLVDQIQHKIKTFFL